MHSATGKTRAKDRKKDGRINPAGGVGPNRETFKSLLVLQFLARVPKMAGTLKAFHEEGHGGTISNLGVLVVEDVQTDGDAFQLLQNSCKFVLCGNLCSLEFSLQLDDFIARFMEATAKIKPLVLKEMASRKEVNHVGKGTSIDILPDDFDHLGLSATDHVRWSAPDVAVVKFVGFIRDTNDIDQAITGRQSVLMQTSVQDVLLVSHIERRKISRIVCNGITVSIAAEATSC